MEKHVNKTGIEIIFHEDKSIPTEVLLRKIKDIKNAYPNALIRIEVGKIAPQRELVMQNIKLDKIIFLLECLVQSQSFGVALTYPDGEQLQAKSLTERYAEQAELLHHRGASRRT